MASGATGDTRQLGRVGAVGAIASALVRCPMCSSPEDRVVDSRLADDGTAIRRRRECATCGRRFTTFERIEEAALVVIKRSGDWEPFDRSIDVHISKLRKKLGNLPNGRERIKTIRNTGYMYVSTVSSPLPERQLR